MRNAGETLTPQLRKRFISVRTQLFQRGIFDPILVRFDTVTVSRATIEEISDELTAVASGL